MNSTRPSARLRHPAAAGLTLLAAAPLAACGDDDNTADAGSGRPQVTFTADDTSTAAPAEIPSGLVDITLETAPGEVGHHIFVARLDDGVTFEEAMDDDDSFFTSMTIKGGNGTIAAGEQALMTLDLGPGNYFVLDNPQNETSPTDQFVVVDSDESRPEPRGRVRQHGRPRSRSTGVDDARTGRARSLRRGLLHPRSRWDPAHRQGHARRVRGRVADLGAFAGLSQRRT